MYGIRWYVGRISGATGALWVASISLETIVGALGPDNEAAWSAWEKDRGHFNRFYKYPQFCGYYGGFLK